MAQRQRFNRGKQKKTPVAVRAAMTRQPQPAYERKIPTQYGKPFVVLEDLNKNTFEYANGAWVPYSMSIAQCRQECQVKELPQKVNDKTRYEIRCPLPSEE